MLMLKKRVQTLLFKSVLKEIHAGKKAFLRFLFYRIKIVVHLLFKELNFITRVSKVSTENKTNNTSNWINSKQG